MSAITIENDLVHYEVLGRGRPVIFVHGWLGSWRYWVPAMQQLQAKYRTYALDLWGFGDSGRNNKHYEFKDQVQLLHDFMEKLGITKAALVGHSLGAAICLRYASLHPDRAPRLALISTPLFDLGGLDDAGPVAVPVVAAPANNTATPSAAPITVTPAAPATTTPAAAPTNSSTSAAPASTTPATSTPTPATGGTTPVNTNTDTIARNPFKGLGETPEEILARLQAKNVVSSAGIGAPAPATVPPAPTPIPAPPEAPKVPTPPPLPTGIATPILPQTGSLAPAQNTTPVPSPLPPAAPAHTDAANPLLKVFTGKPIDVFNKYVEHNATDRDKVKAEVEKADEGTITKSVQSMNGINLAAELHRLTVPTLLLHGKQDPLLPVPSEELLDRIAKGKAAGNMITFMEDDLRHYPMLELGSKFNRLLQDFLDTADLSTLNIQFKEQWRRTMR